MSMDLTEDPSEYPSPSPSPLQTLLLHGDETPSSANGDFREIMECRLAGRSSRPLAVVVVMMAGEDTTGTGLGPDPAPQAGTAAAEDKDRDEEEGEEEERVRGGRGVGELEGDASRCFALSLCLEKASSGVSPLGTWMM